MATTGDTDHEGLDALLADLEYAAEANDRAATDRKDRWLAITRDTGAFLAVLVRATGARRILEIGTSSGYSTLWLASAVAAGGTVITVERSPDKVALARGHFARSGIGGRIEQIFGDAATFLAQLEQ